MIDQRTADRGRQIGTRQLWTTQTADARPLIKLKRSATVTMINADADRSDLVEQFG